METRIWNVKDNTSNEQLILEVSEAAKTLSNNEAVAFPTETVYGLGANALNEEAVSKIFKAKGRPSDNPLIVHIATREMLDQLVQEVPEGVEKLIEHFWPGALTLVLKKKENVFPENVTCGLDSVGIRMPSNEIARALIEQSGVPIAAPSANKSGRPSPTTADHVYEDLAGKIHGIVSGGKVEIGLESTVLDCTSNPMVILRTGGVTKEQIEEVIGPILLDKGLISDEVAPKSPGMKYTHYAPKANFILVDGSVDFLQKLVNEARGDGKKVGVYTVEERKHAYDADVIVLGGSVHDLNTVAEKMYATLREFDHTEVDVIFGEVFEETAIGAAIMNRLRKAAGNTVIKE